MKIHHHIAVLTALFGSVLGYGQLTTVMGTVLDATSGEPIPMAAVRYQDQSRGVVTDFDGNFTLKAETQADSLVVKSIGFKTQAFFIQNGQEQHLEFRLGEDAVMLSGVTIEAGQNPAWRIMREAIDHKGQNNRDNLPAFEYESYSKLEIDVDNMSEKFKERKILGKLNEQIDNIAMLVDDKGREVFPMFISESISRFYVKNDPFTTKEIVDATRLIGVSTIDGSTTSQFVGSSFQQFNFYDNTITVLEKEFVSPLSTGWRVNYELELTDTTGEMNGHPVYEIKLQPKRPQDLVFTGTIWIDRDDFAPVRADLHIPKEANLNFIEGIYVEREWEPLGEGQAWVPTKTNIEIDVSDVNDNWASMVVKTSTSFSDYMVTAPKTPDFYQRAIEVDPYAQEKDDNYWKTNRHEAMTEQEEAAFAMVDTLKNLPIVRTYIDIANIFLVGHKKLGKVELGPYLTSYAWNDLEGHRLRLGFRTNKAFSDKIQFKGYAAYGTLDQRWKYGVSARVIASRYPWTEVNVGTSRDLEQLGVTDVIDNSLFEAFSRWGSLNGPYFSNEQYLSWYRQLNKHFSQKITLNYTYFDPLFSFGYYLDPGENSQVRSRYTSSEVVLETRFSKNEVIVLSDMDRYSLGSNELPTFHVKYTLGISDVLGSDFNYNKLDLTISQKLGLGTLGKTKYWIRAGKAFDVVPYPLLNVHLGNQTPFYAAFAFNMMNYFEFVSDQYVSLTHVHHFEGFFMNRIPLMRKLKWRLVANYNVLFGGVREDNLALIPEDRAQFQTFSSAPYVEVGYGVENIFKLLRVQVFHRLTYLDKPNVSPIGIKGTVQFML